MKYNININQYAVISQGFELDAIDMIIFDMIKDFANCSKCVNINTPEGVFFWVSAQKIMEDLPILGIKTKNGIMKHVDRLCDSGILVKHPNCQQYKMQLYRFGDNYDKLLFDNNDNSSYSLPTKVDNDYQQNLIVTTNKSFENNNINNNNNKIIDTNNEKGNEKEGNLFEEPKEETKDRVTLFSNSDIYKLVDQDKRDYSKLFALFPEPEFTDIDLVYYFHAVEDWSDSANKKRTNRGWKATIRNFIRSDKEKGKIVLISRNNNSEISQEFIDFMNM